MAGSRLGVKQATCLPVERREGNPYGVCQRCTAPRQPYLLNCGMPNQLIDCDFTNTENYRVGWNVTIQAQQV